MHPMRLVLVWLVLCLSIPILGSGTDVDAVQHDHHGEGGEGAGGERALEASPSEEIPDVAGESTAGISEAEGNEEKKKEPAPQTSDLIAEAQKDLHRDKDLLTSVSQEMERLQTLWRKVSEGKGSTTLSQNQLQGEITEIKGSLLALMSNLNETQKDLNEAHQAVEQKETLQDLEEQIKTGKVGINYETGELSGANFSSTTLDASKEHIAAAVSKMQQEADPAILHLDVNLLQDIVLLSVATALGGFAAAVMHLPATFGYMMGGMLIGPSGLNVVSNVVQVETLAQFGSIFLLFCHGMMYSQHYHVSQLGGVMPDTFAAGVLILSAIFFATILVYTISAGSTEIYQATLVASAVSLSSTTTTAHALVKSKLRETNYGKTLVELMAVQDLLMAPLLSIPTAVKEILFRYGIWYMMPILAMYASAIGVAAMISKRLIPKIINLRNRTENTLSLDLFILGIVSYCLLMSLLTEWMGLSHEAGALLAGLILTDVPNVGKAVTVIEPLTCLFGGMYLGSLGMILSPLFLVNHAGLILGCVMIVLAIKVSVVAIGMHALGFSPKASLLGGLSLAQISELSLFLVARAQEYRLISRHVYLMVVATTIVLLVLTPLSSHAFRGVDRSEYRVLVTKSQFAKWFHGHGASHGYIHHHPINNTNNTSSSSSSSSGSSNKDSGISPRDPTGDRESLLRTSRASHDPISEAA